MAPKQSKTGVRSRTEPKISAKTSGKELIILTGISGAGKASALKAFEDLGYQAVDNLPLELMQEFAGLVAKSKEIERAAIVVDVREGQALDRLPEIIKHVKRVLPTRVVFLDAQDQVLVRRYSETRRPHPLRRSESVSRSIVEERQMLDTVRNVADTQIDTSRFNVHELREEILKRFGHGDQTERLLVSCLSFGFKNGVPLDADLVFDVRFLPNPHFVPEFREKTGLDAKVAGYVKGFPQTGEFLDKVTDLMLYLMPHYVKEGKSYLTIAFGCTGGQHRSVMMAEEIAKRLSKAGYIAKAVHRDMPR
ncbi:RNase adapter RapZ [Occallatibacter savannae]|uniref:RNase adapter RapZ n=1 Tax=Occallatibacter savannae TaxID=1002691 RepID=UPI000D6956CF|nr:RNase adapter RapZ [Occallatibacter savannae]